MISCFQTLLAFNCNLRHYIMASPRSPQEYVAGRRIGQLGVGVALVGKLVALPISMAHARRVIWPGGRNLGGPPRTPHD